MRVLWLVSQLWFIVPVNPWKFQARFKSLEVPLDWLLLVCLFWLYEQEALIRQF